MDYDKLKETLASGLLSFPVTDFDTDGAFAEDPYRRRVDWMCSFGPAALFAAGGTGEFFSLTLPEHRAVTAAINIRKRLVQYSDEEFDRLLDLNFKGTFRLARAVGRQMAAQKSGSIILMSSIRAFNVEPGQTIYGATKAAISQMTRGLAADLAEFGLRVNAFAPSIVATPLNKPIRDNPDWNAALASRTALGRWADTTEMVGPAAFLASEASSYVTGTTIMVDAGWSAVDGRFKPPV